MSEVKDMMRWMRLVEDSSKEGMQDIPETKDDEMMYCPTCGWKGKRSELKNGKCPECGKGVVPMSKKNEEKKDGKKVSEKDVISFLKDNPNPSDDDVHDWAEENCFEIRSLEKIFYALATKYVQDEEEDEEEDETE